MGEFKYRTEISGLLECPPAGCEETQATLYRFVREDIRHRENFLPQAVRQPTRKFKDDAECCSGYALSFFRSQESARRRYEGIRKRHDNISKNLGTHLAEVNLLPKDGRLTPFQSDHVDLHEYEGTDLAARARLVAQLLTEARHEA